MKNKKKLAEAYKIFLNSESGKIVLKDLLSISSFTITTYSPQSDVYGMALREGRRTLMLDILKRINLDEVKVFELINDLKKTNEENNNGTDN